MFYGLLSYTFSFTNILKIMVGSHKNLLNQAYMPIMSKSD